MAKAKAAPKAKKSPLDRELELLARPAVPLPTSAPLDPAGADARLRAGWEARAPAFERGLAGATDAGRALYARARAFVDAGMPAGLRDVDEQAAFFAVAAQASGPSAPCWPDFVARWTAAGGLAHAIEIAMRIPAVHHTASPPAQEMRLAPGTTDLYAYWVLASLAPAVAALDPSARAALRDRVAPLAAKTSPHAAAAVAILLDDEPIAKEAIARASAAGDTFRAPWPIAVFDVLRDGETFAHLLGRGGFAFQFFGPPHVLGARGRVPDAAIADALLRFFAAGFAEPRRLLDTYASKFAAVACAFGDPRLAWLFTEHGTHKWLKKHAPLFAERYPELRPTRPSDTTLAARFAPEATGPRPEGYAKSELEALDPLAREDRLIALTKEGHVRTGFALQLLAEHPTPRVAVAIHERIHDPDFATQMPKPGYHKELQEDLRALAKKHPEIDAAIKAAKKAKKA